MNDRFIFRAPIYGADGKFKKFVYWNAENGFPAITCRKGDVFKQPEQCTGLKDKNGRLIFEGDILATSNSNQNNNFDTWDKNALGYTAVIWDKEDACFKGSKWTWEKLGYGSVYDMKFVAVVGNIHENADLLEAENA